MDFEYVYVTLDPKYREQLWSATESAFRVDRSDEIDGHWACDGAVELYRFRSSDEVLARFRAQSHKIVREAGKVFHPMHAVPLTETLWDGQHLASHQQMLDPQGPSNPFSWWAIHIQRVDDMPWGVVDGRGPFYWGFSYSFPQIIKVRYPGATPIRRRSTLGGRPVEVEIYETREDKGVFARLEVSYDPSVGFLPRLARVVVVAPGESAVFQEMYLIEAKPCAAGGFVPTKWCDIFHEVSDFDGKYPQYDHDTIIESKSPVPASLFRAVSFRDLRGSVALTDLKDVTQIDTQGGLVPVKPHTAKLSLAEIKTLAGKMLTNPKRAALLPHLDVAERTALDFEKTKTRGAGWLYVATSLGLTVVCAVAWRRRRVRVKSLLLALLAATLGWSAGCGYVGEPIVKLNAAFKDSYVYIQQDEFELPMTLVLRNDGNQPIKVIRANGGCSCRKVDQSSLPRTLAPGELAALPVRMSAPRSTSPQTAPFELETNHGVLALSVPYFSLISDQCDPDSMSHTALDENETWTFEVTHRAVRPARLTAPEPALMFPKEFTVEELDGRGGSVGGAEQYTFYDRKYRLTLNDRALGLHKAQVTWSGRDGRPGAAMYVLWERLPFLSSNPRRVFLADRPVRFFLQCRDDSVELTRVIRAPSGVKAVIASPRELMVSLNVDAPPVLEGLVQVASNAHDRTPLTVRVTRFTSRNSQ